jgi:NADH:ubiquinone oxidoreductase subunit H
VAAKLDVGLLFVAGATALATAALVANRSPWRGLRAAAHVAWQHVPAAGAVASIVATTGSLRVQEIERAQGGWPWDWLAFRTPAGLVALFLLASTALIEPDAPEKLSGMAARIAEPPPASRAPRGRWLEAACRSHRLVIAGLASSLLLGGWILPGLSPGMQNGRPGLELAGGAWLLAKAWVLVVLLAWARTGLPRRTLAERSRRTALAFLPLSLAALLVTAAWTWWSPAGPVELLVSGALVAIVSLGALALTHRVRTALAAPQVDGTLSPFL